MRDHFEPAADTISAHSRSQDNRWTPWLLRPFVFVPCLLVLAVAEFEATQSLRYAEATRRTQVLEMELEQVRNNALDLYNLIEHWKLESAKLTTREGFLSWLYERGVTDGQESYDQAVAAYNTEFDRMGGSGTVVAGYDALKAKHSALIREYEAVSAKVYDHVTLFPVERPASTSWFLTSEWPEVGDQPGLLPEVGLDSQVRQDDSP